MKRVALVTGGARGIGLGIAQALRRDGMEAAICGVQDRKAERGTFYVRADVSDRASRERLIEAVRAKFGRLHVLVNNAGIAPQTRADILEAGEESFDRVMAVNLKGPYFLTQLAARWMIEQKKQSSKFRGCVVNVSSISATAASTMRGEYCLSKAALAMSTKLWAARLAEFDIPVYEVRPGIIATDMTAAVHDAYDRRIADGLVPARRWGQPDDVGRVVAAVLRGDLPYATGTVIHVDGGLSVPRL